MIPTQWGRPVGPRKGGWTYVVSMFLPVFVEYSKYCQRLNVLNFSYRINRTEQEEGCKP